MHKASTKSESVTSPVGIYKKFVKLAQDDPDQI